MEFIAVWKVYLAATLTLACTSSVVLLLVAERRGDSRRKAVSKLCASACFIGVACCFWTVRSVVGDWIVVGLIFGAIGDAALLGSGHVAFLTGLSSFLLGHLAYIAAFAALAPPAAWSGIPSIGVAVFGVAVLCWLLPRLGSLRIPVVIYIAVFCVMLAAALSVAALGRHCGVRIAVGAALFALSDLSVARDRFVEESFVNKAWGLPTYYAGQLTLAWAISCAGS